MKRLAIALVCAVAAYAGSALGSYLLIQLLSSNQHDRSVEAAMTSAFLCGPLGACVGAWAGWRWSRGCGRPD